jgi:hypothetical protein
MAYKMLDGTSHEDFSYNKYGTYNNVPRIPRPFRRGPKQDRNDFRGLTCPACGITRSMMNKCV